MDALPLTSFGVLPYYFRGFRRIQMEFRWHNIGGFRDFGSTDQIDFITHIVSELPDRTQLTASGGPPSAGPAGAWLEERTPGPAPRVLAYRRRQGPEFSPYGLVPAPRPGLLLFTRAIKARGGLRGG